jgi:hypothetical protein
VPLQWVVCDFTTGNLLADLPDVTAQSALRSTIGQYETNTVTMPLSSAPSDWVQVTRPYAANLIALDENGLPVWGGPIVQRPRDQGDSVAFPVASAEAYFDRRFVSPAVSSTVITTPTYGYYAGFDQNALAADLVTRYVLAGKAGLPGMPVRVAYTASAQPTRTHIYSDADDKTIYSALQDLSGILGGPEWTVTWEWQHNPERITPVFTVQDRIGRAPVTGLSPAATFEIPGPVSSLSHMEDYSSGKGANIITAVGAGQGNSRPSFQQVATSSGNRPAVEFRFSVPTVGQLTVAQIAALQTYANRALTYMGDGATAVTLTADVTTAPVFGVDWFLGDDVGFVIGGVDPVTGADLVPAFPGGLSGVARTVGVERTDTTVAPVIWIPNPTLTQGSF